MTQALVVGGFSSTADGTRRYIAQLAGDPNFQRPSLLPRGDNRKAAVAGELQRITRNQMQGVGPALDALKAQGLIAGYEVRPMANTVVIDAVDERAGDAWTAINKVEGIGSVIRDRVVTLSPIEDVTEGQEILMQVPAAGEQKIEWNVDKINAPKVWAQGFDGSGVTVGVVDTGIDVGHEALKHAYRGTQEDGSQVHDYNFFDAIQGKKEAYDDNAHGTHVSGTIAGKTDEGYHTGVAPGAKLIGSKILSGRGSGTLAGVMKGLEWMLAPTDAEGKNPDPTKAPDIISNSWGTSNGKLTTFRNLMQSFLAAGIEPVFAAGNSGPRSGSLGAPGSYPEVISVAATDKDDKVARFSSRGPSPIKGDDGSDRKPDIAAPGAAITSAVPGGGYKTFNGTSMATPAVSGVVALLLSKHDDLSHDEIVKAITTSAVDIDAEGYDYNAGHGRIDAEAAMAAADAIVAARPKPPTA